LTTATTAQVIHLPSDAADLMAVATGLVERVGQLERQIEQLQRKNRELFDRLFRPKAEKLDPRQVELAFEAMLDLGVAATQVEEIEIEVVRKKRKGKPTGRRPLPKDLPRERVEHTLPPEQCQCEACGRELAKIREEVSEQLEYVPSVVKVIEHARAVMACTNPECEGTIKRAPLPPQPIGKGLPGPGLLSHVVLSKYGDHQPLERQTKMLARAGVELSRSTLCDWIRQTADLAAPLVDWMRADVKRSRIIQTDDTPVLVLEPGQRGGHKGRLWAYLGDRAHPSVIFQYTTNRERAGPCSYLAGYKGYLQADAYAGYDELHRNGAVEVGCWSHARRYFYKVVKAGGDHRALVAMGFVRELFGVEREGRELDAEGRRALREEKSKPVLERFKVWLDEAALTALPKSGFGQAVGYVQNQWQALARYLEDGDLEMDNNASERALRRVAIGRKNWMFAGSDAGGERAAILYSLIASAQRHDVEPFRYLKDLFERLPSHPADRIHELAPHLWAPPQP
jgi:transposase